ncbi:MAG: DUF308 domain-containing protein [Rubrobacter sp.]
MAWRLCPGLTLAVLITLYGAFALVDGGFAIVAALRATGGTRRWLLLVEGVLGIALAVLPGAGLLALAWVIGLLTLAMGVTLMAQALRVRGHRTGDGSRVV